MEYIKHHNNDLVLMYRQAFKMRQTEEQRKLEEMRRQKEEEMLQKRQEYVEKTKNALVFGEMPSEKPGRKGRKARTDQYVSDSGGSGREEGREEAPRERKRKRKASGERKEKRAKGRAKRKKEMGSGESGKIVFHDLRLYTLLICVFQKIYILFRNIQVQKVIDSSRNVEEKGLLRKTEHFGKVQLRLQKERCLYRRKLYRLANLIAIQEVLKSPAGKHHSFYENEVVYYTCWLVC